MNQQRLQQHVRWATRRFQRPVPMIQGVGRPVVLIALSATIAVVSMATLIGCSAGAAADRGKAQSATQSETQGFRGLVLDMRLTKPDFTLTDTRGQPFHFRQATHGKLTLLFFGYTNCPDVCPVHMANIAAVLHRLPYEVTSQLRVVFVTTDPERDTPKQLRSWLDNFDPSFIGLRGSVDEVNRIQVGLGLPPTVRQDVGNGDYSVGHAAQVLAFSPADDRAHVMYPFGTRQQDWAHDLPKLVSDKWGAP